MFKDDISVRYFTERRDSGTVSLKRWIFINKLLLRNLLMQMGARGGAVVEALRYKPEGRGIDSRWCYWNFSLT
jgi:hypothetical protein